MQSLLADPARTLAPPKGDRHGPLPPLLLVLTVVTGLLDAASHLALARVFVANMTGNVVFLGFAPAGAPGLSVTASLVVLLGLAMGLQNAVVRRLSVPDLTTTVLTLTLTGLAADSSQAGGAAPRPGRRILAVLAMFLGALAGGLLLRHTELSHVLGVELGLLVVISTAAYRLSVSVPAWTGPQS